jgi:heat shock protein 5
VQKPLTAPTELEYPALKILDALLKKAKVGKQTVDIIFITGNLSQVTLVEPKISAYFTDKQVISRPDIHPDEAIIRGVCKDANILAGPGECDIHPIIDITYLSLGIETAHGAFTTMIPRFSVLPTRKRKLFSTVRDNQEKVVINVFEGDRAIASKNRLLGVLELAVPLRPRGEPDIEIEFEITPGLDVVVWARELGSGRQANIIVSGTKISLDTQEELDLLREEAEERREEDLRWLENARIEMEHGKEAMSFDFQPKD